MIRSLYVTMDRMINRFGSRNVHLSVTIGLTMLTIFGLRRPKLNVKQTFWYNCYGVVTFMIILGGFIITQIIEIFRIWGNIPLMTSVSFLLFTNLAQTFKILLLMKRRNIYRVVILENNNSLQNQKGEALRIVSRCGREVKSQFIFYAVLTSVTLLGWGLSAEKNQLPLRAWYPFDVTKSPAYEITYAYQIIAIYISAALNVAKDVIATAMIAQTRCRLELLNLSLRNLHQGLNMNEVIGPKMLSPAQEIIISRRLRSCIIRHQATLINVVNLKACLYEPTFAQFVVSTIIFCVTALQLRSVVHNFLRFFSMATYLLNMIYQVFIYCYHGNKLTEESYAVSNNVYECKWYQSSIRIRKMLIILMLRTKLYVGLSAAGFANLSLGSFMAILRASYSLFTLLQHMERK